MKRIEEVIELIELTGDKCVILHKERGAYVVLRMDDYKDLVKIKKKEELSSISRPDTDIRLYEIPRIEEEDIYYPEPLEE